MFQYPISMSFSVLAVTPNIEVKDAKGQVLFRATKKLISSKEEIEITSGGKLFYKVISQESRITDIPSNWDVMRANGEVMAVVKDDYLSALDGVKFVGNSPLNDMLQMEAHRAAHLKSAKMYWLTDTNGNRIGSIAPDSKSLLFQQLPFDQLIRKTPFAYRLIAPRYFIQLGDKTVMTMQKKVTLLTDMYNLQALEQLSETQERMLVCSTILAIIYERAQLKFMYE
jgi:uncharacterized protein YxjI